ncbi:hypothetical protein GCM10022393_39780 [Aquimarina addita]|uniref:Uncharacterized protein n=1 Tax=Aquimarina addita TaxID=870485 RepID=A0ABP6USY6_9FLAO
MKKFLKIITIGCLGIFSIFFIFLFILFYPIIFPDTPEEIERKRVELKEELKAEIENKTIEDYLTTLNIKPRNQKSSEFNSLITEFKNQKHRFKFKKCEFSYNDNIFFLEDSLEHITSVFGESDRITKTVTYKYPKGRIKIYERSYIKTITSRFENVYEKKRSLSVYEYPDSESYGNKIVEKEGEDNTATLKSLEQLRRNELIKLKESYGDSLVEISDKIELDYETLEINTIFYKDKNTDHYLLNWFKINFEYSDEPYDIIIFRDIPYRLTMDMYDFLNLSNLTRNDLDYHRLYFYDKSCSLSSNNIIYTHIESEPYFETSGGGHLTWRGPYNPNKSRSIDYITFSVETLKDLKNTEMENADLLD